MSSWLVNNSDAANVVLNAAMLVVWVAYFQLLYVTFNKQNRPNILINRGAGQDFDSHCIVANMSASPIYVQAVRVRLTIGGRSHERVVSDTEKLQEGKSARTSVEETAQGPVAQGDMLDLGRFCRLAEMVLDTIGKDEAPSLDDIEEMEVMVFAVYTARNDLVGASRRFRPTLEGDSITLVPDAVLTTQQSGWRHRKRLAAQYPLR